MTALELATIAAVTALVIAVSHTLGYLAGVSATRSLWRS